MPKVFRLIKSSKGASHSRHSSEIIPFKSLNCSSPKDSVSIATILNIISFLVKVPVLSENTYEILPNSSGIVLFLAIVSTISLSLFILTEKYVFDISKFTLKDIGIIAQNKIIYLIKVNKNLLSNPLAAAIIKATIKVIPNKYIFNLFISLSKIPILTLGELEFIFALVSFPV